MSVEGMEGGFGRIYAVTLQFFQWVLRREGCVEGMEWDTHRGLRQSR